MTASSPRPRLSTTSRTASTRLDPEQELADRRHQAASAPWEATDDAPGGHDGTVAYGPDPGPRRLLGRRCQRHLQPRLDHQPGITRARPAACAADHLRPLRRHRGRLRRRQRQGQRQRRRLRRRSRRGVPLQRPTTPAGDRGEQHQPARRSARLHRHRRWRGHRQLGQSQSTSRLSARGRRHGQLRFDVGRDGCGGISDYSAWFVDNIKIVDCVDDTDHHRGPRPAALGVLPGEQDRRLGRRQGRHRRGDRHGGWHPDRHPAR